MYLLKILVYIFFLSGTLNCLGQIKKVQATGIVVITDEMSLKQAKIKALEEAKIEALKKAGLTENLISYQALFTQEHHKQLQSFFSSATQTEIQGAIIGYTILEEKKQLRPDHHAEEYWVSIEAEVKMYHEKADPYFKAEVSGVKAIYEEGQAFTCDFTISQNAYLNMFCFTNEQGLLLFPNNYDSNMLFLKDTRYHFPLNPSYKTVLTLDNAQAEQNRLLFLFTKKPYPFLKLKTTNITTTLEHVLQWIYCLSPADRTIFYNEFWINPKQN